MNNESYLLLNLTFLKSLALIVSEIMSSFLTLLSKTNKAPFSGA